MWGSIFRLGVEILDPHLDFHPNPDRLTTPRGKYPKHFLKKKHGTRKTFFPHWFSLKIFLEIFDPDSNPDPHKKKSIPILTPTWRIGLRQPRLETGYIRFLKKKK